jgi:hypothetical protein
MRTGVAHLPLHGGKAPRWLFDRMTRLGRQVLLVMAEEFGPGEILRRVADPYWFQGLGCVLGFDWHSSGVTTTTCGALKEGLRGIEREVGLWIAGGKGGASRKTPGEILAAGDHLSADPGGLVYASRMAAKVDTAALQDGYQLYHHTFFFTHSGEWAVVQQGMSDQSRMARRYHWLGEGVADFVVEPHAAVCCDGRGAVLNLTAVESGAARQAVATLACEPPEKLVRELKRIEVLDLPSRHQVELADLHPDRLRTIFLRTYERRPEGFEALLGIEGVGPRSVRALSLLAELLYGAPASARDPARFSFTHGGKDGHPYPVDRRTYDATIAALERAVRTAKLGRREQLEAFRRLGMMSQ